ncbi:MAG: hypothetical protein AAF999_07210 [Pseudomonadota bacterium]
MEAMMTALAQLRLITARSQQTLVQDLLGASALFVILVVGLHLPVFF